MNYPSPSNYDAIRIGTVDADELTAMREDETCSKLINEKRIGLELDYDSGFVWVLRDDDEAILTAKQFVM